VVAVAVTWRQCVWWPGDVAAGMSIPMPKRHIGCRLGFFRSFCCRSILNLFKNIIIRVRKRKEKKTHTWGSRRDTSRALLHPWYRFRRHCPPCCVSRSLQPLYTIKNKLVLKIRKKDSPNIRLGPFFFCCCSLCCCCIGGGDGGYENGVDAKSKPSESARGRHEV